MTIAPLAEKLGGIRIYPESLRSEFPTEGLDVEWDRMERASTVAIRFRLKGGDSVFGARAEEVGIPIKTFDQEILYRFPLAFPT